jgi:hypothetical protein
MFFYICFHSAVGKFCIPGAILQGQLPALDHSPPKYREFSWDLVGSCWFDNMLITWSPIRISLVSQYCSFSLESWVDINRRLQILVEVWLGLYWGNYNWGEWETLLDSVFSTGAHEGNVYLMKVKLVRKSPFNHDVPRGAHSGNLCSTGCQDTLLPKRRTEVIENMK